jgi:hypothetical protein
MITSTDDKDKSLKPFWAYYGGKWRAAPHYPAPRHNVIVEPFAGAAGYSVRHAAKQVKLYDADPVIVGLWSWLIRATPSDVLALPVDVGNIDDLPSSVPQEARWLIGFWLNKGASVPCKRPSAWMRSGTHKASFWGVEIRDRIARQVDSIKHWTIEQRSYHEVPLIDATWFVDPPYIGKAGALYKHHDIDYARLGAWCRTLRGQVMVCENEGADWLPFSPFRTIKASPAKHGGKKSAEVLWTLTTHLPPTPLFRRSTPRSP